MESVETTSLLPAAGNQQRERKERRYTGCFPTALVGAVIILVVITIFRGEGDNLFHPRTRAQLPSTPTSSSTFPSDFVWGAATSSFQIEGATSDGGRGASIWDTFCKESEEHCNGDTGDITDNHYHRWKQDVQLMKSLGLKAYRFSISWSRILPTGMVDYKTGDDDTNIDGVNYEGVEFYNKLINELLESNIVPFVTLYHWDLPQGLQDKYDGWEDRKIIDDFANYARVCFHFFGDRVKHWITINEGWTVAIHGYEEASNAPGLLGKDVGGTGDPYLVGHHLLLAHATAVKVFREEGYDNGGKSVIGISNSGDFRFPLNPESVDDQEAASRAIDFQLGWMTHPVYLGDYPKSMRRILGDRLPTFSSDEKKLITGSADFLGLNHYSSALASKPAKPSQWGGYWADQFITLSDNPSWKKTAMGWNVAPEGAKGILLWIADRYNNPNVYVTENGVACHETNFEQSIHDTKRIDYLAGYIKGFGEAIVEGVNLKGYFAWSLFDNFEWQYGLSKRFGIVYVNYNTLERTPKDSAKWYQTVIESNGNKLFSNP
jgi:beta-glucosidase